MIVSQIDATPCLDVSISLGALCCLKPHHLMSQNAATGTLADGRNGPLGLARDTACSTVTVVTMCTKRGASLVLAAEVSDRSLFLVSSSTPVMLRCCHRENEGRINMRNLHSRVDPHTFIASA